MEKICGVYKIEAGNKVYIGSSKDIKKRWSHWLSFLRKGECRYEEFNKAYAKDPNSVKFEILDECQIEQLPELEAYYMDYINKIDGWELLNKHPNMINQPRSGRSTKNLSKAQKGENNGNAKISRMTASQIYWTKLNTNLTYKQIANIFGVTVPIVNKVKSERWLDIEPIKPSEEILAKVDVPNK